MHECTPAANTHTTSHHRHVQSSSLASLKRFSSVSSNPPSQTTPNTSYLSPLLPLFTHNPWVCTEIGAELLFCGSLCNQAISCQRPGAVEKGGWTSPKKQQEAACHLSPLLRVYMENLQGRGGVRRTVYICAGQKCVYVRKWWKSRRYTTWCDTQIL